MLEVEKVEGEVIVPSTCKTRLGVPLNQTSRCIDPKELTSTMKSLGSRSKIILKTAAIRKARGLNIPSRTWVEAEVVKVKQPQQTITTTEAAIKAPLCL